MPSPELFSAIVSPFTRLNQAQAANRVGPGYVSAPNSPVGLGLRYGLGYPPSFNIGARCYGSPTQTASGSSNNSVHSYWSPPQSLPRSPSWSPRSAIESEHGLYNGANASPTDSTQHYLPQYADVEDEEHELALATLMRLGFDLNQCIQMARHTSQEISYLREQLRVRDIYIDYLHDMENVRYWNSSSDSPDHLLRYPLQALPHLASLPRTRHDLETLSLGYCRLAFHLLDLQVGLDSETLEHKRERIARYLGCRPLSNLQDSGT